MSQHKPMTRRARGARLLAGILLVASLALAGCSNDDGGGTTTTAGGAELDLVEAGTLTVVILPTQRPTSYLEDGTPKGMAIDFTDALAKDMGLDVNYTAVELQSALTQITAHRYDTAAMGLVATDERKKKLDFSSPWLYGYFALMTNAKSDAPKTLGKLGGKTVGVVTGSQQENLLRQDHPDIKARAFPDDTKMLAALVANQVDGAMLGSNNVAQAQEQYPQLEASDDLPLPDPESYPVAKGNTELSDALSKGVEDLMNDGTFNRLYDKWHPGEPFPKRLYNDYPDMPKHED